MFKMNHWIILAVSLAVSGLVIWFSRRPELGFNYHAINFFFLMSTIYVVLASFSFATSISRLVIRGLYKQHVREFRLGLKQGQFLEWKDFLKQHEEEQSRKKPYLPYLIVALPSIALTAVFMILQGRA